jgi:hypothetical protein
MHTHVPGRRAAQARAREHRPARPVIARLPRGPLSADVRPQPGRGRNLSAGWGRLTGMTVTGRLELVALDAADIAGLASFYAQLTRLADRP